MRGTPQPHVAINLHLTPARYAAAQNVEANLMVSVELRNAGDGVWTPMTLPTSVQVAQTLAEAARKLNLADQIRISPSAPMADPVRLAQAQQLDLKV
jgi:hypothetical protein